MCVSNYYVFKWVHFERMGKKVLVLLDDSAVVLWSVNVVEMLHACSSLLFNERSSLFQQSVKNCLFKSSSFNEQSLSFLCQLWTSKDFSPLQISNWLSLISKWMLRSLYLYMKRIEPVYKRSQSHPFGITSKMCRSQRRKGNYAT